MTFPLLELVVEEAGAEASDAGEYHEGEHDAHPQVGEDAIVIVVRHVVCFNLGNDDREVSRYDFLRHCGTHRGLRQELKTLALLLLVRTNNNDVSHERHSIIFS